MAVSSAVRREVRWRVTGTSAWSDIASCSPVAELTLEELDRTKIYDVEVRDISACGAKSAWVLHSAVIPDVAPGNIVLSDLYADAAAAQAAADAANAALADIASDGILSPVEKPVVIRDYNVITTEQPGIDAQATAYAITTQKTAYDTAVSALTSYLGTLAAPVLWSDLTGNTTIVGATFRSKFADVYTTRQALLNAIYAAAKAKADAAQATADTGLGQVTQLPVINGGFDIAPTGYGWTADAGTGWFTDTTNVTPGVGPNCARHNGGSPDGAYRNNGLAACNPGQRYKAQALIKAAGANGVAYVYISWCNAAGGEIGTTTGNFVTGTTTAGSYADGVGPPGTVYARTCLAAGGHTTGYYAIDNVVCTQYPASIDDVPDGTYAKVLGTELVNGTVPPPSLGDNICPNPGFELNAANVPLVINRSSGDLCDGWVVGQSVSGSSAIILTDGNTGRTHGGSNRLRLSLATGVSLANGGSMFVNAWTTKNLPVTAGDLYYIYAYIFSDSSAVPPAGVTVTASVYLRYYDASGTFIGQSGINYSAAGGSMTTPLVGSSTVPATAAYAKVACQLLANNASGAAVTSTGNWRLPNIDDIVVNKQTALETSGSGRRLGDMRNQVMVGVGNYGAGWSGGSITYSASSTSATITAAAATLQLGSSSLAYNSANVTVSGSAGLVRTYYLYYDDDGYTGGSKTLNATTSQITSLAANGRILVGQVTVTFPTSGTGSGGGGTGCPVRTARVVRRVLGGEEEVAAGAVVVGDRLKIIDPITGATRWGTVSMSKPAYVDCVRVVQRGGVTLSCSVTAPLGCPDGVATLAPEALGRPVTGLDAGAIVHAEIVRVASIGKCWVQHITCEDDFFLAGDQSGRYLAHHNLKPP